MLEGMDEALDGLSEGEETTFESTLAGGERAGETGVVTLNVKNVKVRELPEVDDEFAQLASEFDTVDELREDLKKQAAEKKEFDQGVEARDKVLEALLERIDPPIPAKMVEDEVHRHLEGESRLEDDEHRAEVTEETTRNLRVQFVLDAVVKAEEIEVSQPELIEYIINASHSTAWSRTSSRRCSISRARCRHSWATSLAARASPRPSRRPSSRIPRATSST